MTRILAIGDIHGCFRSLELLLSVVQPTREDILITLGDYVDRGPSSRRVIDFLLELDQSLQLIPLRGNHEAMMVAAQTGTIAARRWMLSGGSETLDSYNETCEGIAELQDIPDKHWDFLRSRLVPVWETENFVFVHGSVEPSLPISNQSESDLLWKGFSSLKSLHCSGKAVICGHEMQESGLPTRNSFGVCIDTGAWYDGWLTCYEPTTANFWQANERGQTRSESLHSIG